MVKKFFKNHPVHKKIVPHLDTLFLLRPTLFFSVWVMVVMGMASAQMTLVEHPLWITTFSWRTFIIMIGVTFICSSTFILNQISDVESDTVNHKLLLVGNYISSKKSRLVAHVLLVIGIIISIAANWAAAIPIGCIYLTWGVIYNQKPIKWKKNPILGWLANSLAGEGGIHAWTEKHFCGRIGSLFDSDKKRKVISSHSGAYTNHTRTKLVSVCDIDTEKVFSLPPCPKVLG